MQRSTLFQAPATGDEIWEKAFNMNDETLKNYLNYLTQNTGNLKLLEDAEKKGWGIFRRDHDKHVKVAKDGVTQLRSHYIMKVDHVDVEIGFAKEKLQASLDASMNKNKM